MVGVVRRAIRDIPDWGIAVVRYVVSGHRIVERSMTYVPVSLYTEKATTSPKLPRDGDVALELQTDGVLIPTDPTCVPFGSTILRLIIHENA